MRKELSFKSFSLAVLFVFLLWFSSFDSSNARRIKHRRQKRLASGSGHRSLVAPATGLQVMKVSQDSSSTVFNVLNFGAKGDGSTDDTKAFESAWTAACKVEASTVLVPSRSTFLVGPISFSGEGCQPNIVFQVDGTIIAPTNANAWHSGLLQWIEFTKLKGPTIHGAGMIDGRGHVWWGKSDVDVSMQSELDSYKMPGTKPTAVRFYGSTNVVVTGITIQNSPQTHLKFDSCSGVLVFNMAISSPGDSPNTDGIHLQNSKDIYIHDTNLACGDDCVSIQTGCSSVNIRNVKCGPGHGISIGGLGKGDTMACVSNITVRDSAIQGTLNGVRIKTWQGGSGSVQGILFSNIQMTEVENPIVIDQFYCDGGKCRNQTAAVALSNINYEKITGIYTVEAVRFACSDALPCTGLTLSNINLKPLNEGHPISDPHCWQTYGELLSPSVPPINCLQTGQPANQHSSHGDLCSA